MGSLLPTVIEYRCKFMPSGTATWASGAFFSPLKKETHERFRSNAQLKEEQPRQVRSLPKLILSSKPRQDTRTHTTKYEFPLHPARNRLRVGQVRVLT